MSLLSFNIPHDITFKILPWLVWLSGLSTGYEPKGHQFNSQSGHMPGLQARSPVGAMWDVTTHWCFSPSLSPSLPLSLKINKTFKKVENLALAGVAQWTKLWPEPKGPPKGRQFDSQSGHMPGLQARSPVGGTWETTTHRCFSPSFSLLYPL